MEKKIETNIYPDKIETTWNGLNLWERLVVCKCILFGQTFTFLKKPIVNYITKESL